MSRAFTREEDSENALADVGERAVSLHRNLVTRRGLGLIEAEIANWRAELAKAEGEQDRQKIAVAARDLRYWTARRENAELAPPEPDSAVVRFGMVVSIKDEDGRKARWKIVGEDEADPAEGTISHVSPMAQALFGKGIGDLATVNGKEWEIVGIEVPTSD